MISVVIPTLNAEKRLGLCLEALISASVAGLVKEVIIVDGGSRDKTLEIAEGYGSRILTSAPGRGEQLRKGAAAARGDYLLFLHADTVLSESWIVEARVFTAESMTCAGVFKLAFDANGIVARIIAKGANFRTRIFKSPYGDQGLLISKMLYHEIGGYKHFPLFEDVELVDRLKKRHGPKAIQLLDAKATTSAARYERDGFLRRIFKNFALVVRYRLGASPEKLAQDYR